MQGANESERVKDDSTLREKMHETPPAMYVKEAISSRQERCIA